jgi:hypothetical protein
VKKKILLCCFYLLKREEMDASDHFYELCHSISAFPTLSDYCKIVEINATQIRFGFLYEAQQLLFVIDYLTRYLVLQTISH